jgi:hypothetical protein
LPIAYFLLGDGWFVAAIIEERYDRQRMKWNWAIFRRWIDIVLLAVYGAAAMLLLHEVLSAWEGRVEGFFVGWDQLTTAGFLAVLTAPLFVPLARLHGLRFQQLNFGLRYPPTWLAAAIAVALLWLLERVRASDTAVLGYSGYVWCLAICVVLAPALIVFQL